MSAVDFEYAIKKDIRNNPIVREVDQARQRELWRSLAVGAFLVGVLLFSAWQHFELISNGLAEENDETRSLRSNAFDTADYREGVRAFMEKRQPNFAAVRLAPPTSAPSTSPAPSSSAALSPLTEPP